jgi:hypothetical protein
MKTMLPRTTEAQNAMAVHHRQSLIARQPSAPASPRDALARGSALRGACPHSSSWDHRSVHCRGDCLCCGDECCGARPFCIRQGICIHAPV